MGDYIDEELLQECQGDVNNELYLHAAMMVKSRADYQFLVPFYGKLPYLHTTQVTGSSEAEVLYLSLLVSNSFLS